MKENYFLHMLRVMYKNHGIVMPGIWCRQCLEVERENDKLALTVIYTLKVGAHTAGY